MVTEQVRACKCGSSDALRRLCCSAGVLTCGPGIPKCVAGVLTRGPGIPKCVAGVLTRGPGIPKCVAGGDTRATEGPHLLIHCMINAIELIDIQLWITLTTNSARSTIRDCAEGALECGREAAAVDCGSSRSRFSFRIFRAPSDRERKATASRPHSKALHAQTARDGGEFPSEIIHHRSKIDCPSRCFTTPNTTSRFIRAIVWKFSRPFPKTRWT